MFVSSNVVFPDPILVILVLVVLEPFVQLDLAETQFVDVNKV